MSAILPDYELFKSLSLSVSFAMGSEDINKSCNKGPCGQNVHHTAPDDVNSILGPL